MGVYRRAAIISVAAMPVIAVALWGGCRLTGTPITVAAACGGGIVLGVGMFCSLFTHAGRQVVRHERERERDEDAR